MNLSLILIIINAAFMCGYIIGKVVAAIEMEKHNVH